MSNKIILPCDVSQVSDGYHTFAELYDHRCLLFVNLVLACKEKAFKTRLNQNGEAWEGWFILGINTQWGQITYHLPDSMWGFLDGITEVGQNSGYDGHTSQDVINRLQLLAATGGPTSLAADKSGLDTGSEVTPSK